MFETLDISAVSHLRPRPLRETRFVVDGHLWRLAAYLRLAGFDTWWQRNADDAALARISHDEHRILLTRDRGLLKRRLVTHGCYVRSNLPREQLREVIQRLDLGQGIQPFTRCLVCNGQLQPVAAEALTGQVLPQTLEHYRAFWRCDHCGKVYWQGSHYQRLRTLLGDVLAPGHSDAGSVTTSECSRL